MFVGSRPVLKVVESGQFFCPDCKKIRDYRKKVVKRYQIVFFIPIVPLKKLAEYVECQGCFEFYDPEKLSGRDNFQPVVPYSNEKLLELWESIFRELNCAELLETRNCSVTIHGFCLVMKQMEGFLITGDYTSARRQLKKIINETQNTAGLQMRLVAAKVDSDTINTQLKKELVFVQAARLLLRNMPT